MRESFARDPLGTRIARTRITYPLRKIHTPHLRENRVSSGTCSGNESAPRYSLVAPKRGDDHASPLEHVDHAFLLNRWPGGDRPGTMRASWAAAGIFTVARSGCFRSGFQSWTRRRRSLSRAVRARAGKRGRTPARCAGTSRAHGPRVRRRSNPRCTRRGPPPVASQRLVWSNARCFTFVS